MRVNSQPQTTQTTAQPTQPVAQAPARASQPAMGRDTATLTGAPRERQPPNVLDGAARLPADVLAGVSGAADGARSARPGLEAVRTAGQAGRLAPLGALGRGIASLADEAVALTARVAQASPTLMRVGTGLARVAPVAGLVVSAIDVGKAVLEQDAAKKTRATGLAMLSVTSGVAGAVGAVAAGAAMTPLVVGAAVIGIGAAGAAALDQFVLDGALSRPLGRLWNSVTGSGG
jgi:hypothetical protein